LTVRLERADRRRLAFASALTLVALPAVWLVNRDEQGATSRRPNLAAVGAPDDARRPRARKRAARNVDPMGALDPLFLTEGTPAPPPDHVSVDVGAADPPVATALATFSRAVGDADTCPFNGMSPGTTVKVVNPANGRSIECVTVAGDDDELVLRPDRFALLSGLDTAPVQVEIHL
jgi:hypothetical protein